MATVCLESAEELIEELSLELGIGFYGRGRFLPSADSDCDQAADALGLSVDIASCAEGQGDVEIMGGEP